MKITHLGQGFETTSKLSVGNKLKEYLSQKGFHTFVGISAFASEAGIKHVANSIEIAKETFTSLSLIVGIDQEGTSKEALYEINNLNINSFIFYQKEDPIFHPKIYLFEGAKETKLILGSSNLTARGLFGNIESSLLIEFANTDQEGSKLLLELKEYYKGLFEFNDPNLFKINAIRIEDFILKEIVPDEANRKKKYIKIKTEQKEKKNSGLEINKEMVENSALHKQVEHYELSSIMSINHGKLYNVIYHYRHEIIENIQKTFTWFWNSNDEGIVGNGICFDIAYNLGELDTDLKTHYNDDNDFGMHIYSDEVHSYIVIYSSDEIYKVDYSHHEYEFGTLNKYGYCDWTLRKGYVFESEKLIIQKVDRSKYFRFNKSGQKFLKYGENDYEVMLPIHGTYDDCYDENFKLLS